LTTPPELVSGGVDVPILAALVERAAKETDVACLRIAGNDPGYVTSVARELLRPAQESGIAVLVDLVDLVRQLGADGVHLAESKDYPAARKALGDRASIGVACPLQRHMAMEAAEAGADYIQVQFDPAHAADSLELVAWWNEMMTVPSVVTCPSDPVTAGAVIAAGADFLAPDARLWTQPDPVAMMRAILGSR
jgi:thiamine-phosphate pyrophosphorylase